MLFVFSGEKYNPVKKKFSEFVENYLQAAICKSLILNRTLLFHHNNLYLPSVHAARRVRRFVCNRFFRNINRQLAILVWGPLFTMNAYNTAAFSLFSESAGCIFLDPRLSVY